MVMWDYALNSSVDSGTEFYVMLNLVNKILSLFNAQENVVYQLEQWDDFFKSKR